MTHLQPYQVYEKVEKNVKKIISNRLTLTLLFCGLMLSCSGGNAGTKIVSLSPGITEIICHLGRQKQLCARSSACDYPQEIRNLPSAGDFARPDTAKILKLKPALAATNELIVPSAAGTLQRYGIKVLFLPCRSLQEYCNAVSALGNALGAESAANRETARIREFCKKMQQKKKINCRVLAVVWHKPVIVPGENTLLNEIIRCAGAETCDFQGTKGYFKPSYKWLLNCNADTILLFGKMIDLDAHPVLKHLKAVKEKRIILFPDTDLLQRPSPRITEGILQLRRLLER